MVLAEALDRLSRDQEDTAALFNRLRLAGVCILTLSEGAVDELHVGLKDAMNALFLRDLAAKIRLGQSGRLQFPAAGSNHSRTHSARDCRRCLQAGPFGKW